MLVSGASRERNNRAREELIANELRQNYLTWLGAPEGRLTALKNLGLVLYVQPLLGAVGGLVLFAIWRAGLVEFSGLEEADWASIMVVSFVGGFSEPFLLRTLERISGSGDRRG